MRKGNTLYKVISLLAAIVIWLYVMGEVDPETRVKVGSIPVSIANAEVLEEAGLAPVYDEQIYISATISGKRSDVNEAKKSGLTAYVDVSQCEEGRNEEKIYVNLSDSLSLENSSQSTMMVEVEEIVRETKPVIIEFSDKKATGDVSVVGDAAAGDGDNTVPWVLGQYPDEVTVSGAESSVDKVKQVVGFISESEAAIKDSKWINVELTPVNAKGKSIYGLGLSTDSAEVEVQKLYKKNVELELTAENEDDDIDLSKIGAPDKIRIVGTKEAIDGIDVAEGFVTKDENGRISIRLELPENVFLLMGEDKWEDYLEQME